MRASVLKAPGEIRVEHRPVPRPGPHDVLVRIAAVGVCGSDTHYYEHGRIGDHVVEQPLVLGHEPSGVVVAVGPEVSDRHPGQRVSLEPGVPTAFSAQTLSGSYNLDPDVRFFATPPVDGVFSEYAVHPAAFAHPVPDSLSDDAAALLEPLSVAVSAVRAAAVTLGDRILVTGAGPVGLLIARCARLAGAVDVVVSDTRADRLAKARCYGATDTFTVADAPDVTGPFPGSGYTAMLDASGAEAAVLSGMQRLAPRARVVLVGMGSDTLRVPVPLLQERELLLTGIFRYANTWPTAVSLAASGAVDLDFLVTSHHTLDEVPAALTAGASEGALKAIVTP
ncbi:NAD(P)-dependent alcohol dehydrogenase [Kocuria tytonis]|uniref:NAD(P)-dependent alcohol dehydrogenase n=1 Tax=Kocuria tytonis TaxID=2054280 RepID=A0A495A412_9MICC|nr:NAD(P)-dependent alcohol dehydrogenase [Kocuria tytonis]